MMNEQLTELGPNNAASTRRDSEMPACSGQPPSLEPVRTPIDPLLAGTGAATKTKAETGARGTSPDLANESEPDPDWTEPPSLPPNLRPEAILETRGYQEFRDMLDRTAGSGRQLFEMMTRMGNLTMETMQALVADYDARSELRENLNQYLQLNRQLGRLVRLEQDLRREGPQPASLMSQGLYSIEAERKKRKK